MKRWIFLSFLFLLTSPLHLAFSQESSPPISRLLVNVSPTSPFSAEELAEALSADWIPLDARNPFKDFPAHFLDYPLVVTSSLDSATLLKLSKRFGYRCVTFSEENLERAIQISTELCQSGPKTSADLPQVSKDEAHLIYDLLSKVDTIFKAHDITYWATGGTLIGALRYQGLMPWDDDVDVCILDLDEKKLEEITADLDCVGLGIVKRDIYKIFFKDRIFVEDYENPGSFLAYNFPAIDVFVTTLEHGKEYKDLYVHKAPYFYWHYGETDSFSYSQIEEISHVPFGSLMIPIPGGAEQFLNNNYGTIAYPEFWKTHSQEANWDHRAGKPSSTPGAAFVEVVDFSLAAY